jgi:hypothetical protein
VSGFLGGRSVLLPVGILLMDVPLLAPFVRDGSVLPDCLAMSVAGLGAGMAVVAESAYQASRRDES